ncbi:UNVERIFIED_CONTAM: hypothetical protein FKN15_063633 [Acipenser sinensis]
MAIFVMLQCEVRSPIETDRMAIFVMLQCEICPFRLEQRAKRSRFDYRGTGGGQKSGKKIIVKKEREKWGIIGQPQYCCLVRQQSIGRSPGSYE